MIISAIVAVAENEAIGRDNELPWRLPDDLKFFKKTTMGKPVLMGRKTFESLGRPLPGRLNIVVSSHQDLQLPDGVVLCHSLDDALARLEQEDTDEGFIIGGGNVYKQLMPVTERVYLTRVHTIVDDAHAFFPHLSHTHWKLTWQEEHYKDDRHDFDFTFQQWDRIREI